MDVAVFDTDVVSFLTTSKGQVMANRNSIKKAAKKRSLVPKEVVARHRAALEKDLAERGIKPIEDFDKFLEEAGGIWPENESIDEFITWLRKSRREGRYS